MIKVTRIEQPSIKAIIELFGDAKYTGVPGTMASTFSAFSSTMFTMSSKTHLPVSPHFPHAIHIRL